MQVRYQLRHSPERRRSVTRPRLAVVAEGSLRQRASVVLDQTEPLIGLDHYRPRAIAQHTQSTPMLGWQSDHSTNRNPSRPTVGGNDQRAVLRDIGEMLLDRRDGAGRHLDSGLPVTAGPRFRTVRPGRKFAGESLRKFVPVQTLERPGVCFAQSDVCGDRQAGDHAECGGRCGRPGQVTAHDRTGLQVSQQGSRTLRLCLPDFVQRNVKLALEPARGVPFGPSVPPKNDAPPAQDSSVGGVSVRSSGMIGQSFQSRSMP